MERLGRLEYQESSSAPTRCSVKYHEVVGVGRNPKPLRLRVTRRWRHWSFWRPGECGDGDGTCNDKEMVSKRNDVMEDRFDLPIIDHEFP